MKRFTPLFDLITAVFLLGTIAVIAFVLLLVANPRSPLNPLPRPTLPPILVQATEPPTLTPSMTYTPLPPTVTPFPATATPTIPTRTFTATFTFTPSRTPLIGGRATATSVRTLQPLPPSPRPATTAAPITGQPYQARPVQYQANQSPDGCKWSSIAGSVVDSANNPVRNVAISIQGGTIDQTEYTGSDQRFGAAGFEVFLGTVPREDEYRLVVLSKTGLPLSDPLKVRTRATCTDNVALVTFIQVRVP
jgi:hypothetical protein